jgi:tetratricopeptide (TPR) repeat protein
VAVSTGAACGCGEGTDVLNFLPTWPPSRVTLGVIAGLIVLAGVGIGAWFWSDEQDRRATAAYVQAINQLSSSGAPTTPETRASAARTLETALARYPSAAMAPLGAYELGNVRYGERDWARARAAYEITAARSASPTLRALARAGVGYAWEAEKNPTKAVESYQAALASLKPGDFYYEDLLLDLARAQEQAGKKDAAVETYRRHLKELPRSPRADEVKARLTRLGASP